MLINHKTNPITVFHPLFPPKQTISTDLPHPAKLVVNIIRTITPFYQSLPRSPNVCISFTALSAIAKLYTSAAMLYILI